MEFPVASRLRKEGIVSGLAERPLYLIDFKEFTSLEKKTVGL
jgi:hypothetical protein